MDSLGPSIVSMSGDSYYKMTRGLLELGKNGASETATTSVSRYEGQWPLELTLIRSLQM